MKKLLVLMMAIAMMLTLAACGEDEAPADAGSDNEPSASAPETEDIIDLVEVTGNGLSFVLPAGIAYAKTDESTGSMLFANGESTAVVTLGVLTDVAEVTIDVITDDVLLAALGSGLSDATLEASGTLEHEGGTSVVGLGQGTLQNGMVMDSVIQYFFYADGSGYQTISYLYVADAGSGLDETIEQVLSSVAVAQ